MFTLITLATGLSSNSKQIGTDPKFGKTEPLTNKIRSSLKPHSYMRFIRSHEGWMSNSFLIQVICHACRGTMKLDGSNEQGSTFTCPTCLTTVTVRIAREDVQ